jgi:hypothetical protein
VIRRWWLLVTGRRRAQRAAWAEWNRERAARLAYLRTTEEPF